MRRDVWEKNTGPREEIIANIANLPTDIKISSDGNGVISVNSGLVKSFYDFLKKSDQASSIQEGNDHDLDHDLDMFSDILDEKKELSKLVDALRADSNERTREKWKNKTIEELSLHLTDVKETTKLTVNEMDVIFSNEDSHISRTLNDILSRLNQMSLSSDEWR